LPGRTIGKQVWDEMGIHSLHLAKSYLTAMGRKKKKAKRFRAVTAVKELARERVGTPPSGQVVLEKKKKPEKHKPTLGKLLGEPE
jgi:hypothetical protein